MAIELSNNTQFSNSFKSPSQHHRPIVGSVENYYRDSVKITKAKAMVDGLLCGVGVTITNTPATTNNILTITKLAKSIAELSGFILRSETFIRDFSANSIPLPVSGTIIDVAIFGSGLETYLPVKASDFLNVNSNINCTWDFTNNQLIVSTADSVLPTIKILGSVEDGIGMNVVAGVTEYFDTKVIKIRL